MTRKKKIALILCLLPIDVWSSDIKSILKKQEDKTKTTSRKVSFLSKIQKPFDHALNSDVNNVVHRCKNIIEEDIVDCCLNCDQAVRFSLLGCCLFCLGYSYGMDSGNSYCSKECSHPVPGMK